MPDEIVNLPSSPHFVLHQLAEGVFAAIATLEGAAFSNAGIIDLGDRTLVFDTFTSPQAGYDLMVAAESLTGRRVAAVVVSHVHSDHWLGNQVFPDETAIITTHRIRQAMPEWGDDLLESKANLSEYTDYLIQLEERLQSESDPRWQASLQRSIRSTRRELESLPGIELRYPDQTFSSSLNFYGSQRAIELITRGAGHSESDISLYLREERLAFIADLGFFNSQPFMPYCDLQAWKQQLLDLGESEFEVLVPGHGTLGGKADLSQQLRYFSVLQERVAELLAAGGTREDALQIELPAPFDSWLFGGMARFQANVEFMMKYLSSQPHA